MKIRGNTVGTPIKPEQAILRCQNLTEKEKAQARANIGADNILWVGYRSDDPQGGATNNATQILEHVRKGSTAVLVAEYEGPVYEGYTLLFVNSHCATFGRLYDDANIDIVEIDASGGIEWYSHELATTEYVSDAKSAIDKKIGEIETALDSIIAIQEELLGVIQFTIGNNSYKAINGMTWSEWCDSEYNTDGWYLVKADGLVSDQAEDDLYFILEDGDQVQVSGSDVISADIVYCN